MMMMMMMCGAQTRPAQQWLETSHVGGSLEPLVRALHSLTAFPSYANAELALRCWPQLLAHKSLGAHAALLDALPALLSLCATLASPKVRAPSKRWTMQLPTDEYVYF